MSNLSPDCTAIFTSWGWELLFVELVPLSSLLIYEFYANIYDDNGSSFRVFLRCKMIKITINVVSSIAHIPRVVHHLFPYLTLDIFPADSLVCSTMFNTPLEGGPGAIHTGSLRTDHQILLHIVCTNLWPVSHTSPLPMKKAQFCTPCYMAILLICPHSFASRFCGLFISRGRGWGYLMHV